MRFDNSSQLCLLKKKTIDHEWIVPIINEWINWLAPNAGLIAVECLSLSSYSQNIFEFFQTKVEWTVLRLTVTVVEQILPT